MPTSKTFISELEDNSPIETVFLAADKSVRETRNGDPYLCVTLQDRTGTIEGRGWDDAEVLESRFEADDFIAVRGRVSSYRDELQITVSDVERVPEDAVELGNFMPHSRWDADTLFEALRSLVDRHVESTEIARFLNALFDDEAWRNQFSKAPAAKTNHHDYLAGLLEHTLSMARLAVTMGRHYNAYYPGLVDADLLVAGCVIHDMGKIDELEYRRSFDYSTEGRLVGHIARGSELVGEVAQSLQPELDEHLTTQLKHLVLSHHGKQEYGSPVTPRSPEAMLLHQLDMIDSRMNTCWKSCKPIIEGDPDSDDWSDYERTFGGSMYVGGPAAQGWQHDRSDDPSVDQGPGLEPGNAVTGETTTDGDNDAQQADRSGESQDENNLQLFGE